MIHSLRLLALLLALGGVVFGQDALGLERGLGSLRIEALRADLEFFADRSLRGRSTPSLGQRVAARFLRARLMRLGWQPAGEPLGAPLGAPVGEPVGPEAQRSWFQSFEVYQRFLDPQLSRLFLVAGEETRELRLGQDYFVGRFEQVQNLELEGGVVFCGRASAAELEACELEGRWALCLDDGRANRGRAARLEAQGALGILLMGDLRKPGDALGRRARKAQLTKTAPKLYNADAPPAPVAFPELTLNRGGASALFGLAGLGEEGAWPALGQALELRLRERRSGSGRKAVENVCALWPGSDPQLAQEVIVVSAHYDHLPPSGARVFQGADDNGSGCMGLLALAEALVEYGPMRRSLLFLWLTGEEDGLRGSETFARHSTLDPELRAICNINIDMIGRNASDSLFLSPSPAHPEYSGLSALTHELAALEGFSQLGSADEYWTRADSYHFSQTMQLPVVFLFSGLHEDYHLHTDTPDKVDYHKLRRASRLVLRLLDRLQVDSLEL